MACYYEPPIDPPAEPPDDSCYYPQSIIGDNYMHNDRPYQICHKDPKLMNDLIISLNKAQTKLKPAKKDSTGYHKNKFASYQSLIEASRQAFLNEGLSIITTVELINLKTNHQHGFCSLEEKKLEVIKHLIDKIDMDKIAQKPELKDIIYQITDHLTSKDDQLAAQVIPCVVTMLLHINGGYIIATSPILKWNKQDIQQYGSQFTYLQRYHYRMLTGVTATAEDDDGNISTTIKSYFTKPNKILDSSAAISKPVRFTATNNG